MPTGASSILGVLVEVCVRNGSQRRILASQGQRLSSTGTRVTAQLLGEFLGHESNTEDASTLESGAERCKVHIVSEPNMAQ